MGRFLRDRGWSFLAEAAEAELEACVEEIRKSDPALAEALAKPLAEFAFASIIEGLQAK